MIEADTKTRILDAAERCFAEQGYGASVRAITTLAGVNLASVHYHFGSKSDLVKAMIDRRFGPMNEERLALLDEALAKPEEEQTIEALLEAFILPSLRRKYIPELQCRDFMKAVHKALSEDDTFIQKLIVPAFKSVMTAYHEAFSRKLPHLSPREVYWRMYFVIGSLIKIMEVEPFLGGYIELENETVESMLPRLLAFMSAGMKAPLNTDSEGEIS